VEELRLRGKKERLGRRGALSEREKRMLRGMLFRGKGGGRGGGGIGGWLVGTTAGVFGAKRGEKEKSRSGLRLV